MRDALSGKIADGYGSRRGVEQQLMLGKFPLPFGRENDALRAFLQGTFELHLLEYVKKIWRSYNGYDLRGLVG